MAGFLYNHNPFYLISALCVLIGLQQALPCGQVGQRGVLVMGVLVGYTLLLALTACLVVRVGKVWDDARTMLLVTVLMFVALAVSFDRLLLDRPSAGAGCLLVGLGFSLAVSEGVLRCLHIRLAAIYRMPFYLLLALLFIYPCRLGQMSVDGFDQRMAWGVFLFPAAAALVLLTLLPAARGRDVSQHTAGTPWSWPLFPWSLFIFLLLVIGLRAYSLSMAFESAKGDDVSFLPYFLTPLVLAAALLLLEIALAHGSRWAGRLALYGPLVALALSLPGTDLNPVAARFIAMLTTHIGSPIQLALAGSAALYAYAWWRGMRQGEAGLAACLVLAAFVNSRTVSLQSFTAPQAWPLAALIVWQIAAGVARRDWLRVVLASSVALLGLSRIGWIGDSTSASLALFCLAAGGAVFGAPWATIVRRVAAPLLPLAAIVCVELCPTANWPWLALAGAISLTALACGYWYREPKMRHVAVGVATVASVPLLVAEEVLPYLNGLFSTDGSAWLLVGLAAFATGALVSFGKAGLLRLLYHRLEQLNAVAARARSD